MISSGGRTSVRDSIGFRPRLRRLVTALVLSGMVVLPGAALARNRKGAAHVPVTNTPSGPTTPAPAPALVTVCVDGNIWTDGGFEATSSADLTNPNYPVVFSTHFPTGHPAGTPPNGTPLCNIGDSDCIDGTDGLTTPRTGNSWAWFGGNKTNDGVLEVASAEQTVAFPPPGSTVALNFYLRIGVVTSPFTDTLEVQVDGVTQQTYTEPSTKETNYTLRTVDLTAFADGKLHSINFLYTQGVPADNNKANFDVDDVSLDVVCGASPTALSVDATGNGILEPDEVAQVKPTWANFGSAPVSLTGTISNFAGPAGATYLSTSTSAVYPTINPGDHADCGSDCYGVQVTAVPPSSRPATHWDTTLQETVSPTSTVKTWTLHVGDSFTDVPHDGYYPFIETILHNGVTGGCGTGIFCPTDPVTRSQMAVFLLKSKHGTSFVPPGCAGIFQDVPCPSQYADWIEELYAEGFTGGCDTSPLLYCPNGTATRLQMAVLLLKALNGSGYAPPACAGIFQDVPCPSQFADWIEKLYNSHITAGCSTSPLLYCPTGPNVREQMAVFLVKTFGLQLYGP
jgi:S-layer homology domain